MALLSGLDRIDWKSFHHAYGPATEVPELLRALSGEVSEALEKAAKKQGRTVFDQVSWTLYGNVFHQGSVWGVSAKVVPFMLELLQAGLDAERREFLIEYLHHLALSYPHDSFPGPFELDAVLAACARLEEAKLPQSVIDGAAFGALPPGTDPEAASNVGELWVRDCFLAVEAGVPVIVPFLEDVDDRIVKSAIALVASFPRAKAVSAPALWRLAKEETDSALAGMALVSLAVLGEPGVREAAQVVSDAGAGQLGGLYSAIAEVLATKDGAVSAIAQEALLSVPQEWLELSCPFTGSVANIVNRAMLRLPQSALGRVVEMIGRTLAAEEGFGKLDAMSELLGLAKIDDATKLDAMQREVVRLIAEHGDWTPKRVNANQANLLRNHRLPAEQPALRALLEFRVPG